MILNIEIVGTNREIDLRLRDEDIISIDFYDDCNRGQDSSDEVTFKELFHLIQDNKKAESLSTLLDFERTKNKKKDDEIKSLRSEIDILKSAFRSVYGD